MKTPTLAEFLSLPAHERKYLRLGPSKGRGSYEQSKEFSPEELKAYLQDLFRNEERKSWRSLRRLRSVGDPKPRHYVAHWCSWKKAVESIFPEESNKIIPSNNPTNLVRVVLQYKLFSYRKYLQARRDMPDIIPAFNQVLRQFGSYGNLKMVAKRESFQTALVDYFNLSRRLGHYATIKECERHGVSISGWTQRYGSRQKLVDLIEMSKASWCNNHKMPEQAFNLTDIFSKSPQQENIFS